MNMRPLGLDVRLRGATDFGDIGQLAANPDLGQISSMRNPLPLT